MIGAEMSSCDRDVGGGGAAPSKALFIYFWLRWICVAARGLSLAAESGACPSGGAQASHCSGFSLLQSVNSVVHGAPVAAACGFSGCGTWA